MVAINPRKLPGKWRDGYALDLHTLGSTYLGDDQFGHAQFDTKRSAIGELLYRLKYAADASVVAEIVEAATSFIQSHQIAIDLIVPVPPSTPRRVQPVALLAEA